MTNNKPSSLSHMAKYAVLAPLMTIPLFVVFTVYGKGRESGAPLMQEVNFNAQAQQQSTALYFIDGKRAANDAADQLDPKEIHSVNIIKGASAVDALGVRGANGVISIITISNQNSRRAVAFNAKLKKAQTL